MSIEKLVAETVKAAREFEDAADPEVVDTRIADALKTERERHSVDGIFTGSTAGIEQYERSLISRANVTALTKAQELENVYTAARETVAIVRAEYETLKMPARVYKGNDIGTHAMLRAADAMETHASYLRLQGRSMQELADTYEQTPDSDAVFCVLVEQGLTEGFRSWPVTHDNPEMLAKAVLQLRRTVAQRKAARVPEEVVKAEEALAKLMPAPREARIRLLKDGRLSLVKSRYQQRPTLMKAR